MPSPAAAPASVPAPTRSPAAIALTLTVLLLLQLLAGARAAPAHAASEDRAVILFGAAGLRWDDVSQEETPALWELSQTGSLGDLAVRSVRRLACPADGWLAVSAGKRAADTPGSSCRTLEDPGADGVVPGWDEYAGAAAESTYGALLGTLGAAVRDGEAKAVGFGPGAAIALAAPSGVPVGDHTPLPTSLRTLEDAVRVALITADLIVIDAGAVRDAGRATAVRATPEPDEEADSKEPETPPDGEVAEVPPRADQVAAIDRYLGAIQAALTKSDRTTTLLVASIADSGREPRLQLAAATGPAVVSGEADFGSSLLGSLSTRQDGIFQTTDLTPSVLTALGLSDLVASGTLVGSPVRAVAVDSTADPLFTVRDIERHAIAVQPLIPPFFIALVFINLGFYLLVTLGLNSRAVSRLPSRLALDPRVVLLLLSAGGVSIAAIPVATYLANAIPWWRTGAPGWTLFGLVVAIITAITLITLRPRWERSMAAPIVVVAGLTMLVLCYDAATGGRLQISALMGAALTVAGRFFGLNNQAFALLATSSVLVAVVAADPLVRRGRRRSAAAVIGAIGIVVTVLDGTPGLGSDFGGPPVLVPGFFLFVLMALGIRITVLRVLGVLGTGLLVVSGFALIDWLRPVEERTHLGRFVDTVLDGGLWDVVSRKLDQNLANLGGTWLTLLALGGIALVVLVLARPIRAVAAAPDGGPYGWLSGGAPLRLLGASSPLLGAGLATLGVVLALGFALNDSGIVIPAIGVSLAVPLLVAVCAGWMRDMRVQAGLAPPRRRAGSPGEVRGPA